MTWRTWTIEDWNSALVSHYFMRRDEEPIGTEIKNLIVSARQIAKATGESEVSAEEAKEAFFDAIRESLRSGNVNKPLVRNASHRLEGWNPTSLENVPPFFAHIFAICCAASFCESPDDASSVHSNLRENILGVTVEEYDQGSFSALPDLLREFETWTRRNSDRYRVLVLPALSEISDPRMTLIGQAVTLTFPRASDVSVVAMCLSDFIEDGAELSVDQLPKMAMAIQRRIEGTSRIFKTYFRDFQDLIRNRKYESLPTHPMWDAIRAAMDIDLGSDSEQGPWLFADYGFPEGFDFAFLTPSMEIDSTVVGYPDGYGGHWVVGTDVGDGAKPTAALFDDYDFLANLQSISPRLARNIRQGVLLFVPATNSWLQLARNRKFDDIQIALIRGEDLLKAFIDTFGGKATTGPISGWFLVNGAVPRLLTDQDDTGMLSTVSCLHAIPGSTQRDYVISGGVRIGDSYLGNGFKSPSIRSGKANEITFNSSEEHSIKLTSIGDRWTIPDGLQLRGRYQVVGREVTTENEMVLGWIHFENGPDRPIIREPAPQNYLVESASGFRSLADRPSYFSTLDSLQDLSHLFVQQVVLGVNIGEFPMASTSIEGGWNLTWNDSSWSFDFLLQDDDARCTADECTCAPEVIQRRTNQLKPLGMGRTYVYRSRWRELLLKATPANPCAFSIRRRIRGGIERPMNLMNLDGESFRTLPTLHPEASNFTAAGRSGVGVSEQLNDLRRTILSLAYDRSSGIEPTDWVNAVRYFLGPIADPFLVLRAWQESGRISVVSQARWNRWRIFPEVPTLAIYKTFEGFQAIGAGLWAPEQEGSIGSVMTCQSWEQKHSHSIGNLSPQMHRWTGGSESEKTPSFIKEACLQESIRLCSLDVTRLIGEWGTGQYDSPGLIAPDSEEVITYEVPGLGEISQHRRRSSPKFWSVPGNPYCWSYSRPLALALLSKEKGEQPYLKIGTNAIGTIHSQIHIPLPFARLAAWTGPAAPGPAHASGHVNGRWIYEFPSQGVRDEIYSRISLDLRKRQQQLPEVHNA